VLVACGLGVGYLNYHVHSHSNFEAVAAISQKKVLPAVAVLTKVDEKTAPSVIGKAKLPPAKQDHVLGMTEVLSLGIRLAEADKRLDARLESMAKKTDEPKLVVPVAAAPAPVAAAELEKKPEVEPEVVDDSADTDDDDAASQYTPANPDSQYTKAEWSTWDAAELVCNLKGKHLCPLEGYCPNGQPIHGDKGKTDTWAPYHDPKVPGGNTWVNLGTLYKGRLCHTHIDCCSFEPAWGKPGGKGEADIVLLCCGGAPTNELANFGGYFRLLKSTAPKMAELFEQNNGKPVKLVLEKDGMIIYDKKKKKELASFLWESVSQVQAVKADTDPESMEILVLETTTSEYGEAKIAIEFDDAIKVRASVSKVFGVEDENAGEYDLDCTTEKDAEACGALA
jgi:hypothetical protein